MAEQSRPPIVTILGHVDHGKTTLLDFIRKSSVAAREHGGITQAIGAYQISIKSQESRVKEEAEKIITFIDTPGHAAFEKMRSRGAKVADIAVLVVAADDGVMPQTIEAIKHIQEAKVPMIVALNKIDLGGIDIKIQAEKIKKQLSDQKILIEEYGGDVPVVPLSAKSGEGVDKLLEMIQLVSEVNDIKGDPSLAPAGVVIEANIDKFRGPVATILIRNGTLKKGDTIVLGGVSSRVRNMVSFDGSPLESAGPSTPVEVIGLEAVPEVGAVLGQDSEVTEVAKVQSLIEKLNKQDVAVLRVILKADKQGSLEAIEGALLNFNVEEEHIKIMEASTGDITDKDIKLAASVGAIILGFNAKVVPTAQKLAENEQVLIRTYNIIYELLDEMKDVVEGMLEKGALEEIYGTAQILAEFPYGKDIRIAGCKVLDGQISKGPKVRVVRDDPSTGSGQIVVGEGKIKSLKKVKEEVVRVEKGDECGMMIEPQIDFAVGDIVQSFRTL